MTRAYISFPEYASVDAPRGGIVRSGGDVFAPTTIACTPTGTAFGPLYIGVPDAGVCTITNLSYLPSGGEDDDGILIFGLAAGAGPVADGHRKKSATAEDARAPENPPASSTRRQVLALAGATLAAGAAGIETVAGQSADELVALHIAEFEVTKTTAPMVVRVLDIVDEVLPPSAELLVDAQETRVGKITEPAQGVTLPADTTGKVSVYLRDARGRLARLLAWARGVVGGEEEIAYARQLPKQASAYSEGTYVPLTEHPAIVGPVKESGADGTNLFIGNTEIPHTSESASEVGAYAVFNDELIFEVGSNPPAARDWRLKTRLGLIARLTEGF